MGGMVFLALFCGAMALALAVTEGVPEGIRKFMRWQDDRRLMKACRARRYRI